MVAFDFFKELHFSTKFARKDSAKICKMAKSVKREVVLHSYANTLREYQKSQDEMKSETRDKALAACNERMDG